MVETSKRKLLKASSFQSHFPVFRNIKEKYDKKFEELLYEGYKEKYVEEFQLSVPQFDLIWSFFKNNSNNTGTSVDLNLIKYLMNQSREKRPQLKATRVDTDRCVDLMDLNGDKRISLDEFIKLLSLFFASRANIKSRLMSALRNQSFRHENTGSLNEKEASDFENFLIRFYNVANLNNSPNYSERISYSDLAEQLSNKLESFLFVQ